MSLKLQADGDVHTSTNQLNVHTSTTKKPIVNTTVNVTSLFGGPPSGQKDEILLMHDTKTQHIQVVRADGNTQHTPLSPVLLKKESNNNLQETSQQQILSTNNVLQEQQSSASSTSSTNNYLVLQQQQEQNPTNVVTTREISLQSTTITQTNNKRTITVGTLRLVMQEMTQRNNMQLLVIKSFIDKIGHELEQRLKTYCDTKYINIQDKIMQVIKEQLPKHLHELKATLPAIGCKSNISNAFQFLNANLRGIFTSLFVREGLNTVTNYGLFVPVIFKNELHWGCMKQALCSAVWTIDAKMKHATIESFCDEIAANDVDSTTGLYIVRLSPYQANKRGPRNGPRKKKTVALSSLSSSALSSSSLSSLSSSSLSSSSLSSSSLSSSSLSSSTFATNKLMFPPPTTPMTPNTPLTMDFLEDGSLLPQDFLPLTPIAPLIDTTISNNNNNNNSSTGDDFEDLGILPNLPLYPESSLHSPEISKMQTRAITSLTSTSLTSTQQQQQTSLIASPKKPCNPSSKQSTRKRKSLSSSSLPNSRTRPSLKKATSSTFDDFQVPKKPKGGQSRHDDNTLHVVLFPMTIIYEIWKTVSPATITSIPHLSYESCPNKTKLKLKPRSVYTDSKLIDPRNQVYAIFGKPLTLNSLKTFPFKTILQNSCIQDMGLLTHFTEIQKNVFMDGRFCHIGKNWIPQPTMPIETLARQIINKMRSDGKIPERLTQLNIPDALFCAYFPKSLTNLENIQTEFLQDLKTIYWSDNNRKVPMIPFTPIVNLKWDLREIEMSQMAYERFKNGLAT